MKCGYFVRHGPVGRPWQTNPEKLQLPISSVKYTPGNFLHNGDSLLENNHHGYIAFSWPMNYPPFSARNDGTA